jgi:arginyl-tRNA synthetase
MSSRTGNVVLGEWLLDEVKKEIYNILETSRTKGKEAYQKAEFDDIAEKAAIAAVKYAFLKVGTLQEIAFDIKESVNLNGDSGPYLLYTYARCKSVMRKAEMMGQWTRDKGQETLRQAQGKQETRSRRLRKMIFLMYLMTHVP